MGVVKNWPCEWCNRTSPIYLPWEDMRCERCRSSIKCWKCKYDLRGSYHQKGDTIECPECGNINSRMEEHKKLAD